MRGLREWGSRLTCGGSGVGSENDAAVVSDADDRRSHGVRGVEIHIVHWVRHSERERRREEWVNQGFGLQRMKFDERVEEGFFVALWSLTFWTSCFLFGFDPKQNSLLSIQSKSMFGSNVYFSFRFGVGLAIIWNIGCWTTMMSCYLKRKFGINLGCS